MCRPFLLLWLLLVAEWHSCAQGIEPGAEAASLGGSYVTNQNVFSSRHNVAGMAGLERNQVAFGVRNHYLTNDLNDLYLLSAFPIEEACLGLDLQHHGFDAFQVTTLGVSYARAFHAHWLAGARLSYSFNQISEESVLRQLLAADISIQGSIGHWRIGVGIHNLIQSQWRGRIVEHQPIVFRLGGAFYFENHTFISCEIYKSEQYSPDVRLGLSYEVVEALIIRFGVGTLRPSIGMGCTISIGAFRINLATSWHQQLGVGPICDVVYAW